ncbi:MFS transporter [Saccharothrix sp. BKS2]|uniref:MFS transporter n=1 Tax=Saccharothrix sp. BKS2 TaxID=3064400 RepID=UPI0039E99789
MRAEGAGLPLARVLLVLGVAPPAEVVLIPVCGVAATRWGPDRVVLGGCVAAGVEVVLPAHVDRVWQLALLQVLGAVAVACLANVGMAAVRERFPRRDAFGTGVFVAARSVAGLLGNGAGGLLGSAFGLRWVFLAAAVCSFLAAGLCALVVARPRRPVHGRT